MRTEEQLLEDLKPFADSVIEHLPPRGDSYVSWNHYTQRLLYTHGSHSYEVTNMVYAEEASQSYEALDDDGLVYTAMDGSPIMGTKHKGSWVVSVRLILGPDEHYDGVGQADTALSAESNAYKRACAHAGIGLHLYEDYWIYRTMMAEQIAAEGE